MAFLFLGQLPGGQRVFALEEKAQGQQKDNEKEPPLERLLQLNAGELFGADAAVTGNRVTLKFPDNGAFGRAFLSRGAPGKGFFSNAKDINTVTVKDLVKESEGKLSFAAIQTGSAVSRFQLADDFKISFKLKIPNLGRSGQLSLRFNQSDQKNFIQTNFFQEITLVGRGRPRQVLTQEKPFAGPPSGWFDKTSKGVPVEIVFKDKKLTITLSIKKEKKPEAPLVQVQVISMDGIDGPMAGKMVWTFNQMSFVISDLEIVGMIHQAWAEEEIARLREKGQLLRKEPEAVASADANKEKAGGKGDGGAGAKPAGGGAGESGKKGAVNIDEPDPEADEDL